MAKKQKTIYYRDELNDEFSSAVITPKKIDANYRYVRDGFFERAYAFFMYRIVAQPLSWLFLKIKFAHRIRNKKVLRGQKKPYFIYANHTSAAADPFVLPVCTDGGSKYADGAQDDDKAADKRDSHILL